jgi:hypothetical protein
MPQPTELNVEPGSIVHVSSQNCAAFVWEQADGSFHPWGFGPAYVIRVEDGRASVRVEICATF